MLIYRLWNKWHQNTTPKQQAEVAIGPGLPSPAQMAGQAERITVTSLAVTVAWNARSKTVMRSAANVCDALTTSLAMLSGSRLDSRDETAIAQTTACDLVRESPFADRPVWRGNELEVRLTPCRSYLAQRRAR